jgi:hypothetical protein
MFMLAPRNNGEGVTDEGRLKKHFLKRPQARPTTSASHIRSIDI